MIGETREAANLAGKLGRSRRAHICGKARYDTVGRIGRRLRRFVQRLRPSRLPCTLCFPGRASAPYGFITAKGGVQASTSVAPPSL